MAKCKGFFASIRAVLANMEEKVMAHDLTTGEIACSAGFTEVAHLDHIGKLDAAHPDHESLRAANDARSLALKTGRDVERVMEVMLPYRHKVRATFLPIQCQQCREHCGALLVTRDNVDPDATIGTRFCAPKLAPLVGSLIISLSVSL